MSCNSPQGRSGSSPRGSRRSPKVVIVRSRSSSTRVTALRVPTARRAARTFTRNSSRRASDRRPCSSGPTAVNSVASPARRASCTAATAPPPAGSSKASYACITSPASGTRGTRANCTHSTWPTTPTLGWLTTAPCAGSDAWRQSHTTAAGCSFVAVPAQTLALALAASIYPPAVAAVIALGRGPQLRSRVFAFVLAALAITYASGTLMLFVLVELGATGSLHWTPRAAFDLALGLVPLGVAVHLRRGRPEASADPATPNAPSKIERYLQSRRLAFALGLTLYAVPSP